MLIAMDKTRGNERKSPNLKNKEISERLNKERHEALKLLESQANRATKVTNKTSTANMASVPSSKAALGKKSPVNKENFSTNRLHVPRAFPVPKPIASLRKISSTNMSASKHTLLESNQTNVELNKTEYVPPKTFDHKDISELLLLDSITLSNSSIVTPDKAVAATPNLSFNPNEMTGRSTLHQRDAKAVLQPKRADLMSTDEILMTSWVPSVRQRRLSAMGGGGGSTAAASSDRNSVASSCISDLSAMQKNPRPTSSQAGSFRMSQSGSDTFNGGELDFSFGQAQNNLSNDESFAPAELMQSRLINDEIEWAQKKLAMPAVDCMPTKEAKAKLAAVKEYEKQRSGCPDIHSETAMTTFCSNEMSIGEFFRHRSDNISCIVQAPSPPRDRRAMACALISDDTVTTTTSSSVNYDLSVDYGIEDGDVDNLASPLTVPQTPAIDDRTYEKPPLPGVNGVLIRDSKDSGNASGKSLDPLDFRRPSAKPSAPNTTLPISSARTSNSSSSNTNVATLNGFVTALVGTANAAQSGNPIVFLKNAEQLQLETDKVLENKENIEAFNKNAHTNAGSTTLSFTDSLLNTSIHNYRMSSVGQARAPLSPIPILIMEPKHGDEADIDEYVFSPVNANRRKRFSKSPPAQNQKQNLPNGNTNAASSKPKDFILIDDTDEEEKVPDVADKNKEKAALSGHNSSNKIAESTTNESLVLTRPSKTLTPTHGGCGVVANGSKSNFEISPLSSPRSYVSSPLGSINGCQCSPHFDRTNNSDQRFLSPNMAENRNGLRRVASSPCTSVASAPAGHSASARGGKVGADGGSKYGSNYGVPPMRTYSSTSVKSIESNTARSVSRCSNNSEFSHRDGRSLPLKATALELTWGSIKLHKSFQKSLQIRNTSEKRLVVRMLVYGPGFQLINPESNLLTLTSQECRTISINFRPTVLGPAFGKLSFESPRALNNCSNGCTNSCGSSEFIIPLYGYGGHASIHLQNIIKSPLNVSFFQIGELCDLLVQPLEGEFRIHNKGPLMGFAYVRVEASGALHVPGLCNAFSVVPECTLIPPNSTATVRLVFAPQREELKKIRKIIGEVLTLAKLRIIYGDEAMRQRLRQLYNSMPAHDLRREQLFAKTLDNIWKPIRGERALEGLENFRQEVDVADDIWSCLKEQEAAITLTNNMQDETAAELSTMFSEADNTILFRTVCQAPSPTPQLETLHEHLEEEEATYREEELEGDAVAKAAVSSTTQNDDSGNGGLPFYVLPASVEFDFLRTNARVPLVVFNNFRTRQYFNVACNHPDVLYFVPDRGYIEPHGGQLTVVVHAHPVERHRQQRLPNDLSIMVYMDTEKITVPVRVPSSSL